MTVAEIILTVAVILGPLLAVVVTRYMESCRIQREQRMYVFRTLMRTRRGTAKWSVDHVAALNLIEVEFRNDKAVQDAWKEHFKILSPGGHNLQIDHLALEKSLANLLQVISRNLGYNIEGLEIFGGGYTPQSWDTSESDAELQFIRKYVIALSQGKEALPVKVPESTISQQEPTQ